MKSIQSLSSDDLRQSVTVGGSVNGTFEDIGDDDWFSIQPQADQTYTLSLFGSGASSLAGPYLVLHDSIGTFIAENDNFEGLNSQLTFTTTTMGTPYINAGAYRGNGVGAYTVVANVVAPSEPTDSIDWGSKIATRRIEVYFAPAGQTYDGVTSEGWNSYEIGRAMAALVAFSEFTNLTFTRTNTQANAEFTLVLDTNGEIDALGYFNPPGEPGAGVGVFNGAAWDRAAGGSLDQGGYDYITLIHEFGHGLGLAHPHDRGGTSTLMNGVILPYGSYGDFDLNQGIYTMMSYNDGWQTAPHGASSSDDYGWEATAMAFDISVLQEKYRTVAHNTGANVYTLPAANAAGTFYSCLWDTGGIDTIRAAATTAGCTINLQAATLRYEEGGGGWVSYMNGIHGGFTIANGVVIENAFGSQGSDLLTGNAGANVLNGVGGADVMRGGHGADAMKGGLGADAMRGELGADDLYAGLDNVQDKFILTSRTDSGKTSTTWDEIFQFDRSLNTTDATSDKMDLRLLDADDELPGDQAFRYVTNFTSATTTQSEGQVRVVDAGAHVHVQIDFDGDNIADSILQPMNIETLTSRDFLL